jgi:ribA/ribD-fused uncharacterized protein
LRSTSPEEGLHEELMRRYICSDVVVVYKTKDAFGGLSNMASGYPLQVNGVRILTTEALYQACRFPHLPEVQSMILAEASPMTAKMRSKPYRAQTRPDWDEIRFKVMRWCLRVKLAQNFDEFGRLLLATREKQIVEQSRKDDYWGAKLSADGETLVGQNVLGRLLMELRERLLQEGAESLKVVEPLPVPDFALLGRPIQTVCARSTRPPPQQPLL